MLQLILNKWIWMPLSYIIIASTMWFAGNIHGHTAERNSLENKQRIEIIKNQNMAIDKLQQDKIIQDKAIEQLQKTNEKLQEFNKKIQDEIKKDQDIIDKTNKINGYFLRIIQSAASGKPAPQIDPSKTYKPSEVDSAIVNLIGQCQDIRNKYIALQNVIREMTKNANR